MKLQQLEEFGKKLFLTTTKACVWKVTAKDKNSVLGYHLTRVSVTYAGIGVRYLLSCSMCLSAMCCVLCLRGFWEHAQMVPSSLSTGGFRMVSSDLVLTTFAFNINLRLAAEWPGGYRDNLTSGRSLWIKEDIRHNEPSGNACQVNGRKLLEEERSFTLGSTNWTKYVIKPLSRTRNASKEKPASKRALSFHLRFSLLQFGCGQYCVHNTCFSSINQRRHWPILTSKCGTNGFYFQGFKISKILSSVNVVDWI